MESMLVDSESCGGISLRLKGVELDEFDHRKMKKMELGLKTYELQNIKWKFGIPIRKQVYKYLECMEDKANESKVYFSFLLENQESVARLKYFHKRENGQNACYINMQD